MLNVQIVGKFCIFLFAYAFFAGWTRSAVWQENVGSVNCVLLHSLGTDFLHLTALWHEYSIMNIWNTEFPQTHPSYFLIKLFVQIVVLHLSYPFTVSKVDSHGHGNGMLMLSFK